MSLEDGVKEFDGEMGYYKITGEAFFTDENQENKQTLEIGSIQHLPVIIGDGFVKDGVAEVTEAPTPKVD